MVHENKNGLGYEADPPPPPPSQFFGARRYQCMEKPVLTPDFSNVLVRWTFKSQWGSLAEWTVKPGLNFPSLQTIYSRCSSLYWVKIAEARKALEKQDSSACDRVEFKIVDVDQDLPFRDGSVDIITAAQALHWFDHDQFYKHVDKALKPGGFFMGFGYGNCQVLHNGVQGLLGEVSLLRLMMTAPT